MVESVDTTDLKSVGRNAVPVQVWPGAPLLRKNMYWIELDYRNGKTVRKEYTTVNDSYAVWKKCGVKHAVKRSTDVIKMRMGFDNTQTGEWGPRIGLRSL